MDNQPPSGELLPLSDMDQLVAALGIQHEKQVLAEFQSAKQVVAAESIEHTQTLMQARTEVIYQAQLMDIEENILGIPDFLVLTDEGDYQPWDAKLALDGQKDEFRIQLGIYRQLLRTELPGVVILGNGSQEEIGEEADAITDKFIEDMRDLLNSSEMPTVHYSHSRCRQCPYYQQCRPIFEQKGALSMVYGIQGRAAAGLEAAGIPDMQTLANKNSDTLPSVPYLNKDEKKARAILQAKSWLSGEVYQRHDISLPKGTWCHFDIEDNPLTSSGQKHVYLWGFLLPPYSAESYEAVWTDDEKEDKAGWMSFLDRIQTYQREYPDLILAHYSSHERSTIKPYAERYEMMDNEAVCYLLGEDSPFFDMQKPVVDNLVLPILGYGLKDICKNPGLVNFQWEDDESGSEWSIVVFNRFLNEKNLETKQAMKESIMKYNEDDVVATRRLEEWLRETFAVESS